MSNSVGLNLNAVFLRKLKQGYLCKRRNPYKNIYKRKEKFFLSAVFVISFHNNTRYYHIMTS